MYSPGIAQRMVWLSGLVTYEQAMEIFERVGHRLILSASIWRQIQDYGARMEAEIRCQERQVSSERVVLASRRGQEVGCKGVSQVLYGVNMAYAAVLGSPQAFAPALWKVAVEQDIPDADESSVTADGAE